MAAGFPSNSRKMPIGVSSRSRWRSPSRKLVRYFSYLKPGRKPSSWSNGGHGTGSFTSSSVSRRSLYGILLEELDRAEEGAFAVKVGVGGPPREPFLGAGVCILTRNSGRDAKSWSRGYRRACSVPEPCRGTPLRCRLDGSESPEGLRPAA